MTEAEINEKAHLMDYITPNPVFVMEQQKRSQDLTQVGSQLKSISKLFAHVSELGEKLCNILNEIHTQFTDIDMIKNDPTYSSLTQSFKVSTMALNSHFVQVRNSVIQPLDEFVNKDLKSLNHHRKTYEHCATNYNMAVEKHVASSQKHFQMESLRILNQQSVDSATNQSNVNTETNLIFTHQQVTEAFFDFSLDMSSIEQKLKYLMPNLFISYLSVFELCFKNTVKEIRGYKKQFDDIKSASFVAEETYRDIERREKRERKDLHEFIPKFWSYVITLDKNNANNAITISNDGDESQDEPYEAGNDSTTNIMASIEHKNRTSMQGYLWKKCHFNGWKRRFFIVANGVLSYGKSVESVLKSPKSLDLLLCASKPEPGQQRRNCFSVRSPKKCLILQAVTAWEMDMWVSVIVKNIIAKAQNNPSERRSISGAASMPASQISTLDNPNNSLLLKTESTETYSSSSSQELAECKPRLMMDSPSKNICADCGATNATWVSITYGVCVCTACAGVHRSLSSSVSTIRSLELDDIPPIQLALIDSIGSDFANSILESALNSDNDSDSDYGSRTKCKKIHENANNQQRRLFIQKKYQSLSFVKHYNPDDLPNLFDSIKNQSLRDVYTSLIIAKSQQSVPSLEGFTPLHAAVCIGNPVVLEFVLLQLPSCLNEMDDDGWLPLSYAAYYQCEPLVQFLIDAGADPNVSPTTTNPWLISKALQNKDIELALGSVTKNVSKDEQANYTLPDKIPHPDFTLQDADFSILNVQKSQRESRRLSDADLEPKRTKIAFDKKKIQKRLGIKPLNSHI